MLHTKRSGFPRYNPFTFGDSCGRSCWCVSYSPVRCWPRWHALLINAAPSPTVDPSAEVLRATLAYTLDYLRSREPDLVLQPAKFEPRRLLMTWSEPLIETDTAFVALMERVPMPPGGHAPGFVTGRVLVYTLANTPEGWTVLERYPQIVE